MHGSTDFQTPPVVCDYMASLIPDGQWTILEPTPGIGNLVKAAMKKGNVVAPGYFEDLPKDSRFDYVIMNPPFTPMAEGYKYLKACMNMSDNIIALLPWFILINSERRLKEIEAFGLKSVTAIPRKTFPGTRIQCCILELCKGYQESTILKSFHF